MRALVWNGGSEMSLQDVPAPAPSQDEVLLWVRLAGICGSDLHAYRGHHGPRRPPLILGHEAVGRVDGLPGRYAVFPLTTCGRCAPCRRGDENLCERRGLLGLSQDGVFADAVAVPRTALVALPGHVTDEEAALAEPLAVAVAALDEHELDGRRVAVLGCGPIGLLTTFVARTSGAHVVAVDPLASRREHATAMGADSTHASADDLPSAAFDIVVDAVGAPATMAAAVQAARNGATIELVGLAAPTVELPLAVVVRRGIALRGRFAYTQAQFERAVELMARRPLPAETWTSVLPLSAGAEAFQRLTEHPDAATKILLAP